MANHKSAKKRTRQTVVRTLRNKAGSSQIRTCVKKVRDAISKKDKTEALALLPKMQAIFSKMAHKGILKKNTASRKTSRLASQISNL